jgi:hypothetical protein
MAGSGQFEMQNYIRGDVSFSRVRTFTATYLGDRACAPMRRENGEMQRGHQTETATRKRWSQVKDASMAARTTVFTF